ncbi:hypothetical protein BH11GEM1_BH11GEM1_17350 [soil metagenome]
MISYPTLLVLRVIHVVLGVCWAGALVFIAAFLLPALKASGPAAAPVMAQLSQVRKMPDYLIGMGLLTLLSGTALFWNDSAGFNESWMQTGPGRTFSVGGTLGVIVLLMGLMINVPTSRKLGALSGAVKDAGGPPSAEQAAEIARLQGRLATVMRIAAVLIVLAAAAMSVARYIPA